MSKNRRYKPKKASFKRIVISLILILAVVGGIYALVTKDSPSTTEENQNIHDVNKAQDEQSSAGKVSSDVITDKGTSEDGASTVVTDDREEGPTTTESSSETTNEEQTSVTMPKQDQDAIIANAKTQVYTILAGSQQGSGFLINTKGDIITNAHVANEVKDTAVINANGQEFNGRVIGIDDTTDVALIRVPDLAGKNPLVIDTAQAVVGTKVVAIGSPHAHSGTTTTGEITSVGASFTDGYSYTNLYEITAKLEAGSSGGPLINMETGNVIGINSIILTDRPEIGYALPMANVMGLVNKWAATNPEINFNEHDEEDEMMPEYTFEDDEGFTILKAYVEDFFSLVAQDFDYKGQRTYLNFIQDDSAGYINAPKIFDQYTTNEKSKQSISYTISNIDVVEDYANVTVNVVLSYFANGQEQTLTQSITFKYIIEYSDYMITDVTLNSSTASVDEVETSEERTVEDDGAKTTTNGATTESVDKERTQNNDVEKDETSDEEDDNESDESDETTTTENE